jgi:hypothetical protein
MSATSKDRMFPIPLTPDHRFPVVTSGNQNDLYPQVFGPEAAAKLAQTVQNTSRYSDNLPVMFLVSGFGRMMLSPRGSLKFIELQASERHNMTWGQ